MKKNKLSAVAFAILSILIIAIPSIYAADTYANYELLSTSKREGIDYIVRLRRTPSKTAIIAIHGGSIEPGTSELANAVARTKHDFYSFEGIMSSNNFSLHITSTSFDEPKALSLVKESNRTLSIHGFSNSQKITYVGGLDKIRVNNVKNSLKSAGYIVMDAPIGLTGSSINNITNKNIVKAGVQIEVSSALRSSFFKDLTTEGRLSRTSDFYKYSNALIMGIEK